MTSKNDALYVTRLHPAEYLYVLVLGGLLAGLAVTVASLAVEVFPIGNGRRLIWGVGFAAGAVISYRLLVKLTVRWTVWPTGVARTEGFLSWACYEVWVGFDVPLHATARSGFLGWWLNYGTVWLEIGMAGVEGTRKLEGFVADAAGLVQVANEAARVYGEQQ